MKQKLYILIALFWSLWSFSQTFIVDGINYEVLSATTSRVIGNTGVTGAVVIPQVVTDPNTIIAYTVQEISGLSFSNNTSITNIVLPNTITSIGSYAFRGCTSLTAINIPNLVASINPYTFYFCTSLTSVTMSNSVVSIGAFAFSNCSSLTTISLPSSLATIQNDAFNYCNALTAVNLSASITTIGDNAFRDCNSLKNVTVNWINPFTINTSVFSNLNTSKINLITPFGTENNYEAAPVWTNFNNGNPTNITLSPSSIIENGARYATVGTFNTTDLDSTDSFAYSLVSGAGDTDNNLFYAGSGNDLILNEAANYEAKNSYSIRVRTTDQAGSTFEKQLTITVLNDVSDDVIIQSTSFSNVLCNGQSNGTASISVSGGSQPYTYSWSPSGGNGSTASGLSAGTYTVTVTDSASASVSHVFTITQPDPVGTTMVNPVQNICGNATFADLVPPPSSTIRWYYQGSSFSPPASYDLYSGPYDVVTLNENGCEGPRTTVNVVVARTPDVGNGNKDICDSGTIADLFPTPSATVSWFADATTTTPLDPTTVLTNGTSYYVEQTNEIGCPVVRVSVAVNIIPLQDAPALPAEKTSCQGLTFEEVFPEFQNDGLNWYNQEIGGNSLNSNDPATAGTYYVSVNVPPYCESARTVVTLVIEPSPAVPILTLATPLQNTSIFLTAVGSCNDISDYYNIRGAFNNKGRYFADNSGNYEIYFDGTKWLLNSYILETDIYENTTNTSTYYPPTTGWVALGDCSGSLTLAYKNYEQTFCEGVTVADIVATGTNIEVHDGFNDNLLPGTDLLLDDYPYNLYSKSDAGCYSSSVLLRVTLNPLPDTPTIAPSDTTTFCAGGSVTLTSSSATGNVWSTGETTESITVSTSGTYNVAVTNGDCTSATSEGITVTVNPLPTTGVTESLGVLTATQTGATYQWYECPSTLLTGETNQTFTPTASGDYKVEVTMGSCTATSACTTVTVTTLSNKGFELNSNFKISPNPATSSVSIETQKLDNASVEVTDINGRQLFTQKLNNVSNNINIGNLSSGTYFFKVTAKQGSAISKVVKN
jgi:BspA type Leucine rich repeat region (6 copies)/Secretion system C-terminal sorting domain/SprB repeat/Ig-like domain CHU_C associated